MTNNPGSAAGMPLDCTDAQKCIETTTRFFWHLDRNDYTGLMALMTGSAIWYRQGLELTPGSEMLAILQRRSHTRTVVHLLSNLAASGLGPDRAKVTGYLTAYAHDSGVRPAGPAPLDGASSISMVNVELARSPGGWKLHRSRLEPLFKQQ